jgi:hypothetical protein
VKGPEDNFATAVIHKTVGFASLILSCGAPLLGLEPRFDLPPADHLILASAKEAP